MDCDRCSVVETDVNGGYGFVVKSRGGKKLKFRASSEDLRKKWISGIQQQSSEVENLLKNWGGEKECLSCIASFMNEDQTVTAEDDAQDMADDSGLMDLLIRDVEGVEHTLSSLFEKTNLIVLVLMRHFG